MGINAAGAAGGARLVGQRQIAPCTTGGRRNRSMAFFAGDSNRYMSVRDRATQRQRDEEDRTRALARFAKDMTTGGMAT